MKSKLGMLVLVLLVFVSLFAPRMLFAMQDSIRFGSVKAGQHESWDITTLVTDYEASLSRRLNNFAKGLKEQQSYYVTALENGTRKDAYDMMEQAWEQEMLLRLLDVNILDKSLYDSYNIEQWKSYVVYDKDYENGVAFLLGYVKVSNTDGMTLEILMDTQTGTVYYARLVTEIEDVVKKEVKKNFLNYIDKYDLWYMYDMLLDYYEANSNEALEKNFLDREIIYVQNELIADEQSGTESDVVEESDVVLEVLDTGNCIRMDVGYTDGGLEGIFQLTMTDNNCLIVDIGLADIEDLIQEFQMEKIE